ncbi:hypothetical protein M427DRAFT_33150 [Gonapodya prolifera JEL478]|uniref:Uncharacterized protein n=1 Tax=Gonapodya prolifera (strain JEL478) TaxID=1344416 RepID=A0A139ACJ4_GONPJ|nr:hypothetical protein M427DRAFT_33150 [Gonapodya prolifera JEL478]|eukprot:KXS14468.1 hypothetical protein M427DRAFT_33150 [Gonapodya prolifera JEL478]
MATDNPNVRLVEAIESGRIEGVQGALRDLADAAQARKMVTIHVKLGVLSGALVDTQGCEPALALAVRGARPEIVRAVLQAAVFRYHFLVFSSDVYFYVQGTSLMSIGVLVECRSAGMPNEERSAALVYTPGTFSKRLSALARDGEPAVFRLAFLVVVAGSLLLRPGYRRDESCGVVWNWRSA